MQTNTYGTTTNDYAQITYWWSVADRDAPYRPSAGDPNRVYCVDVNNPKRGSAYLGAMTHRATLPFGSFKELVQSQGNQVVDLTDPNLTIKVTKISKITERDYVLDCEGGNLYTWQYVVRDCNHYNHAFNRFAKRVRTHINPELKVSTTVIDARPIEEPTWPKTIDGLSADQANQLYKWAGENAYPYSRSCACDRCRKTYRAFVEAQNTQEEAPVVSVESVLSLIDSITREVQNAQAVATIPTTMYDLFQVYDSGDYREFNRQHLCGHEDALTLIFSARELIRAYDGVTPHVRFEIYRNLHEADYNQGATRLYVNGEDRLAVTISSDGVVDLR